MPNNLKESYDNFKKAYNKLKEFIETDNKSEKDRAAIIHVYEYTFELWWKTLQRYLQDFETIEEYGPGATMQKGTPTIQLNIKTNNGKMKGGKLNAK